MFTALSPRRQRWLVAVAAVVVVSVTALWLRPQLERAVRARIEAAAVRDGAVARMGLVRVGIWPLLRVEGFDLDLDHGVHLHADRIAVTWPGRLRLAVRGATLAGLPGVSVSSAATAWDVADRSGKNLTLTLVEPQEGLSLRKRANPAGSAWHIEAHAVDVGRLIDLQRDGNRLLEGGIVDGDADFQAGTDALRFQVALSARAARLEALADNATDQRQLGAPTDVSLRFEGDWQRAGGTLEIPKVQATVAGAALSGAITVRDLDTDPVVDLALGMQHLDFAQLLGASGLAVPDSLEVSPGIGGDLGSAAIDVRVRGRLSDPASLAVSQKIDFAPPRQVPPGIARLRGDFIFKPDNGPGPHRPVDVSPASPDFIALREVPPLFVRTLLLAEDAGFYGHRGIDLRELPTAVLTDFARGGAARGASTITQQLAKNLFLTRDKQLGRKLQELAITFLLESALGKDRILEVYLNIIEWGPELRGLRPAARHYFGREPHELTPAQMAFLVSIIPGPIKYQVSFAHGSPGPGLRSLIDELLAKLRSVGALGEEDYRRALAEPIVVAGGRPPG